MCMKGHCEKKTRCPRPSISVQDLILTMAELETLGVAFVVPGHIDMSTPMGRMMAHLLSAVTELERELIRKRVRSGLSQCPRQRKAPWSALRDRAASGQGPVSDQAGRNLPSGGEAIRG